MAEADRFWIGHDLGHIASARGILKSGFRRVGELFWLPEGGFGLLAAGLPERGEPAAAVLGARLLERPSGGPGEERPSGGPGERTAHVRTHN